MFFDGDSLAKWDGEYFPENDIQLAKDVRKFGPNLAKDKKKGAPSLSFSALAWFRRPPSARVFRVDLQRPQQLDPVPSRSRVVASALTPKIA